MTSACAPPGDPATDGDVSGLGIRNTTGEGDCSETASVSTLGSHSCPSGPVAPANPQLNVTSPEGSRTDTFETVRVNVDFAVPFRPAALDVAVEVTRPMSTVGPPGTSMWMPRASAVAS